MEESISNYSESRKAPYLRFPHFGRLLIFSTKVLFVSPRRAPKQPKCKLRCYLTPQNESQQRAKQALGEAHSLAEAGTSGLAQPSPSLTDVGVLRGLDPTLVFPSPWY